jgi:nucleoside 2-deoxyribosyltransferase
LKVLVCGSIGYGGLSTMRRVQSFLGRRGFSVIDQTAAWMDYSGVADFRERRDLVERIVKRDLEAVEEADVVVAVCEAPSFGTAVEMFVAKQLGKRVVLFSRKAVRSPWPVKFSDRSATSMRDLLDVLSDYPTSTGG